MIPVLQFLVAHPLFTLLASIWSIIMLVGSLEAIFPLFVINRACCCACHAGQAHSDSSPSQEG